ncbi:hypothetical protein [Thauera linaloolentis]|uniref:Uncharacterized protein n=1 Tax=Thauera linaloolentis (strain DSM 12138 / JCM 21573 / CCUG 41526 / CIP 105981 / IAM 15112 / NBRC 102519 / 47Lol) TaxID=1123367 RepID=N6Z3W3_THAL4|nr:hypothetical protein [Thauera linaloolentis]ENO86814.1 hypothetical protein C666_12420 [Thauera linaloolentis 47Lol = DSM 12138]MCM8564840.1 hypothetical protein [Thauera linaloolentis]
MSKFLPMLFLIGLFFVMWLVLYAHQRRERQKRALPLREDFLAAQGQPEAACHACGKGELKDEGLGSGRDVRRIVSCAACDTLLYRYERPAEVEAD